MNLYDRVFSSIILLNEKRKKSECKIKPGKTVIQKVVYLSLSKVERNEFYKPYLYGPFSEKVQELMENLIINDRISYDFKERGYSFVVEQDKKKISDEINERIEKVVDYLKQNHMESSDEISNFAKVFMIKENNEELSEPSKLEGFIKERSKILGWKKLSSKKASEIKQLITLSEGFSAYVRS